ncbi:hypothetical protein KY335_03080 [Candidatus Woesearchaeota archaeon]|nr:hypothetical protein [Candidatus Woesearchaeota archaeon]
MGFAASELKLFLTSLVQVIHTDNAARARVRHVIQNLRAKLTSDANKISGLLGDIERSDVEVPRGAKEKAENLLHRHEKFMELLNEMDEAFENIPFKDEAEDVHEFMHEYELVLRELERSAKEAVKEGRKEVAQKEREAVEQAKKAKIEELKAIMKQKQAEEMKKRAMGEK